MRRVYYESFAALVQDLGQEGRLRQAWRSAGPAWPCLAMPSSTLKTTSGERLTLAPSLPLTGNLALTPAGLVF